MNTTTMPAGAVDSTLEGAGVPYKYRFPWKAFVLTGFALCLIAWVLSLWSTNKVLTGKAANAERVESRLSAEVRVLETRVANQVVLLRQAEEREKELTQALKKAEAKQGATTASKGTHTVKPLVSPKKANKRQKRG